jgi:hypothetical protein
MAAHRRGLLGRAAAARFEHHPEGRAPARRARACTAGGARRWARCPAARASAPLRPTGRCQRRTGAAHGASRPTRRALAPAGRAAAGGPSARAPSWPTIPGRRSRGRPSQRLPRVLPLTRPRLRNNAALLLRPSLRQRETRSAGPSRPAVGGGAGMLSCRPSPGRRAAAPAAPLAPRAGPFRLRGAIYSCISAPPLLEHQSRLAMVDGAPGARGEGGGGSRRRPSQIQLDARSLVPRQRGGSLYIEMRGQPALAGAVAGARGAAGQRGKVRPGRDVQGFSEGLATPHNGSPHLYCLQAPANTNSTTWRIPLSPPWLAQ